MPSDNTEGDELQLNVEATEDSETADDAQATEDGEGGSEEKLNLQTADEEVDKPSPAEEQAKRQEEAWLNKVISEKAKVEDAPKWLQARLNARLEATGKTPETEEVVKKVLAQERENQDFQTLQNQIPTLTASQAKELQERFAELKPLGKVKALKTALDLMGLSSKVKEAEQRGAAKARTSLPKSGRPSVRVSDQAVGGVPLDVIHDDKKWNEMIRKGQQA
jgi:hypothetical protein